MFNNNYPLDGSIVETDDEKKKKKPVQDTILDLDAPAEPVQDNILDLDAPFKPETPRKQTKQVKQVVNTAQTPSQQQPKIEVDPTLGMNEEEKSAFYFEQGKKIAEYRKKAYAGDETLKGKVAKADSEVKSLTFDEQFSKIDANTNQTEEQRNAQKQEILKSWNVKKNPDGTSFIQAGVVGRETNTESDIAGLKVGSLALVADGQIAGNYVVNLTGDETTNEQFQRNVVNQVLGNLTQDEDIKRSVLDLVQETHGDQQFTQYTPLGKIPIYSKAHAKEVGMAIDFNGETFTQYQDKDAELVMMVKAAQIAKAKHGEVTKETLKGTYQTISDYYKIRNSTEDAYLKELDRQGAGGEVTFSQWLDNVTAGFLTPIYNRERGDSNSKTEIEGLAEELGIVEAINGKKVTVGGLATHLFSGNSEKEKQYYGELKKHLEEINAVNLIRQTNKIQSKVMEVMRNSGSSIVSDVVANSVTVLGNLNKMGFNSTQVKAMLDSNNIVPKDAIIAGNVLQFAVPIMASAVNPAAGMATILWTTEKMTRDLPVGEDETFGNRNIILGTTLATMGLSSLFGSKIAQAALSPAKNLGAQAITNVAGSAVMNVTNIKSFFDEKGKFQAGEFALNLAVDVFQLASTTVNAKKVSKEVPRTLNLFMRDVDNPDNVYVGMLDRTNQVYWTKTTQEEFKLAAEQANTAGKPVIVSDLNATGIQSMIANGAGVKDRIMAALTGVAEKSVEKTVEGQLKAGGEILKVVKKEDIPQSVINSSPPKEDRTWNIMKVLEAGMDIHEARVQADVTFFQTVKSMMDKGLVNKDEKGFLTLTDKGKTELETISKVTETVQADADKLTKTLDIGNGKEIQLTPELQGNPFVGKYYRREGRPPVRIYPSELLAMSPKEREAVTLAVAAGKLQVTDEGYIASGDYILDSDGQKVSFGNTQEGYEGQFYFKLGEALQNGEDVNPLVQKFLKTSNKTKEQVLAEAPAKYKKYLEQIIEQKKEFKEFGVENGIVDLSLPFVKKQVEEPVKVAEPEVSTEKSDNTLKANRDQSSHLNKVASDYTFRPLEEGESLPKSKEITLKDEKGRLITLTKHGKYDVYSDVRENGAIQNRPHAALERDIRSGLYTYGEFSGNVSKKAIKERSGLSDEDHVSNQKSYESKTGEIRITPEFSIDPSKPEWSLGADTHFEVDPTDPSNFVGNRRLVDGAKALVFDMEMNKDLIGGFAERPNVVGRNLEKGIATERELIKNGGERKTDLLPEELDTLQKLADTLKNSSETHFSLIKFHPDVVPYSEFRDILPHERTHVEVAKLNPNGSMRIPEPAYKGALSTEHGAIIREATKGENWDDNTLAHEILANGASPDKIDLIGIKSPEHRNAFYNVYKDLLSGLDSHFGEGATDKIKGWANPEVLKKVEALNNERTNENRPDTGGERHGISEGERGGGVPEDVLRTTRLGIKSREEWRGTGIKSVTLRRYTHSGDPLELTGYRGEETARRKLDGADPTINFFVQKPDGQFIIEAAFRNTQLLPFETKGDFHLVDLGTDVEAWNKYSNLTFPKFQEWAESKGYQGFFSGREDLSDATTYRASLFSNESNRKMLSSPQLFAIKAHQNEAGFYSPTEEAVLQNEKRLPKVANGKDWYNKIKGLEGVKTEELDWMGLDIFLENKDKVSKEDVLEYIQTHKVEIKETVVGGTKEKPTSPELQAKIKEAGDRVAKLQLEYDNAQTKARTKQNEIKEKYGVLPNSAGTQKAINAHSEYKATPEFKELEVVGIALRQSKVELDKLNVSEFNENKTNWSYGNLVLGGEKTNDVEISLQVPNLAKGKTNWKLGDSMKDRAIDYEEPHGFPDNTYVHIRGNERLSAMDRLRKLFHIEEIQSQLHQTGKKEGYKISKEDAHRKWTVEVVDDPHKFGNIEYQKVLVKDENGNLIRNRQVKKGEARTNTQEIESAYTNKYNDRGDFDSYADEVAWEQSMDGIIPDAPFKTNWIDHGFLKALRYAVENGYDKLTWTTGKQQIDRNQTDLRKNIKKIEYSTDNALMKGHVDLGVTDKDGKTSRLTVPLEGKAVRGELKGKTLDQLLGKKMADEIRAKKEGVFEGEGLSIGGGLHKFVYDEYLPRFAAKFGKKFGAEVGKDEVHVSSIKGYYLNEEPNGKWNIFAEGDENKIPVATFETRTEAEKYRKNELKVSEEVHSMTIPQAMKESVQMGMKMFSKSREQEQVDYVHRLVEPEEIRKDLKMRSFYETSAPKAHAEQIETLVKEGFFSNISAVKEGMSPEEIKTSMASLKKDLEDYGLQVVDSEGRYTMESTGNVSTEPSFMVYYPNKGTSRIIQAFSNKYGQEAAFHGEAGKYSLEFQDGKRITTDKADFDLAKDKDGTVITLPDGKEIKYSADFGKGQEVPAPQDFASQIAQANKKIEIRKNLKDTTILTPEDIKSAWNEGIVIDAQGNKMEPNAVFDESGKKVGTAKVDSDGREFVEFDKPRKGDPVYLIDGKSTSGDKVFKNNATRTLIGTTGMFQELATMSMPEIKGMDKSSPEYKREVLVKGITGILDQSIGADINAVGRTWFTEKADEFAARVGKDVKDVTNSVVKLALWLHTAVTSPNTGVKDNANYAMNALASMVRMHKTGELHIPEFQVNNDGSYKMKPDGTPTKLGMSSLGMEKTRMLTEGYVPVASVEGKEAVKNGGEVRKEAKGNYVLSPVAKAMMDKHGTLQGLFSYLLSPTVDGSKFNKATDIYGDKVGAFMSNLMGFTQIPTIDTWMNRYLMGLTGDAIAVTRDKSGKVISIKDNTQNFIVEQGNFYRAAIQKATADFNTKTGQNLSPADVQAIVWTQVRSMFDSLSRLESKEIDFTEAHAQIKEQFSNKGIEMPSAPHNPELIAEANNKTPIVKAATEEGMGKVYGKDYFVDQDPSGAFFVRERTALEKKNKEIDLSEPDLKKGDFDAWLNVAVRMIDNANLSDGEVAQIKKLSDAKDIDGLNKFVLSLNKMSVVQLIAQALRVNPLIGLKNLARNTISNEFHQIMDEAARLPSFVINTILTDINRRMGGDSTQSIYAPSFASQAKGLYKAVTEGIPDALKFMVHGGDTATFENGAIFREKTTGIWALKPLEAMVKYGFRLQEAADKPFKAQAYYRALDGLTKLKQKEMGKGTSYEDARNNLTVGDYDQAFDISLYLSFQDKNAIAKSFYKWKDGKSPLVQALTDVTVPYVKTPLNVVKVMADYSGIYPILKLANKNFSHDNWKDFRGTLVKTLDNPEDRAAISWALGKGAVGLAATMIGHSLAKAGIMTAFYEEKDGKEKDLMGARGTSYGSVVVDGKSYDISAMNPVAFYLLAGAAWANKEKTFDEAGQKIQNEADQKKVLLDTAIESGDEDKIKLAQKAYDEAIKAANPDLRGSSTSAVMTTILKNFALQVPVLSTAIRTLNDSDNEKNFIPNLILNSLGANRVLPAIAGEVAQKMDGKARVIEYSNPIKRLKDTVQSMIPSTSVGAKAADATGLDMLRGREALPVKYDMLGREIAAPRAFDPFKTTDVKEGKLETELNRFKVVIPHSGVGTSVEKNEEKGKKGQYFTPALEELVNSPTYNTAPDTIKKKMLQDTIGYLNPEYKNDKLKPEEEKHNLSLIRERDLFGYEIQTTPEKFSRDRVITDEKLLKLAAKAKIKELSLPVILEDIRKSGGMDKFLRTQFTHNIMVGKDTSYEESKKNYAEFVQDPEGMIVKWYLKDKEYDERQPRLKARRAELVKEGKTEAEINAIMAKDRVNQAKVNKANLSPKIVMKAVSGAKLADMAYAKNGGKDFEEQPKEVEPNGTAYWGKEGFRKRIIKNQRQSKNIYDYR